MQLSARRQNSERKDVRKQDLEVLVKKARRVYSGVQWCTLVHSGAQCCTVANTDVQWFTLVHSGVQCTVMYSWLQWCTANSNAVLSQSQCCVKRMAMLCYATSNVVLSE